MDLGPRKRVRRGLVARPRDWPWSGWRAWRYGTSILRNALALAAAMQIEDGNAGL